MVLLAAALLLTAGAKVMHHFPGDVAVTRLVQGITPTSTGWAQTLSSTAEYPVSLVLVEIVAIH